MAEFNLRYGFKKGGITKRDIFINDLKIIGNLSSKKRYQNYNLDGHTDTIRSIDVKNGIIVSGSKDKCVKIWDTERKKAWTFEGKHTNQIDHVLLWDQYSAFSGSIDKSIRYFDIRDWGKDEGKDTDTVNGYHHSKYFMGHNSSITQMQRLGNSQTRIVSSSMDSTIKIWDLYANDYCEGYSNCNVVGRKFDDKTEVVEALHTIEGDHSSGIRLLAQNS